VPIVRRIMGRGSVSLIEARRVFEEQSPQLHVTDVDERFGLKSTVDKRLGPERVHHVVADVRGTAPGRSSGYGRSVNGMSSAKFSWSVESRNQISV
jgi:hypothetical protein